MAATREARIREASQDRRERERQQVRANILEAAEKLFKEHGYADFSLREVAEHAGYSPTTIYRYFEHKDDLLYTISEEGFDRFDEMIQEAAASTSDPVARVLALGRAYIQFGAECPAHYELMFMQRCDFLVKPQPDVGGAPRVDSLTVLREAVEQAVQAGAFVAEDVEQQADALWATTHGLVSLYLAMPFFGRERLEQAADVALRMCIHGLHAR